MKSLLLVAHGSRREASNEEVRQLAHRMRARAEGFDEVNCAFLELAEPSIPDALRASIGRGMDDILVLPYFLSRGRHVVEDIPGEIETVAKDHPEVSINTAPYLGLSEDIVDLLLGMANAGMSASPD